MATSTEPRPPLFAAVRVLTLRPGDILVLKTSTELSKESIEYMLDSVRQMLKVSGFEDVKVMVTPRDIEVEVMRHG